MNRQWAGLGSQIVIPVSLAILATAVTVSAQETRGCPAPPDSAGARPAITGDSAAPRDPAGAQNMADSADIVLFASFAARTVHFRSQPRVRVRLCWGSGGGDTLRVVERRNLPSPVVAGITYRDVYVAVELLGHLNATCLLRELGFAETARTAEAAFLPAPPCVAAAARAAPGATPGSLPP